MRYVNWTSPRRHLLAWPTAIIAVLFLELTVGAAPSAKDETRIDPKLERWLKTQDWQRDSDTPALGLGEKGAFDDQHIFAPHVIRQGKEYWMYYCGSQRAVDAGIYKGRAQDAAVSSPAAIRANIPEQGRVLTFKRAVVVDALIGTRDDLKVDLNLTAVRAAPWGVRIMILAGTLLVLGIFASAARSFRRAASQATD